MTATALSPITVSEADVVSALSVQDLLDVMRVDTAGSTRALDSQSEAFLCENADMSAQVARDALRRATSNPWDAMYAALGDLVPSPAHHAGRRVDDLLNEARDLVAPLRGQDAFTVTQRLHLYALMLAAGEANFRAYCQDDPHRLTQAANDVLMRRAIFLGDYDCVDTPNDVADVVEHLLDLLATT